MLLLNVVHFNVLNDSKKRSCNVSFSPEFAYKPGLGLKHDCWLITQVSLTRGDIVTQNIIY